MQRGIANCFNILNSVTAEKVFYIYTHIHTRKKHVVFYLTAEPVLHTTLWYTAAFPNSSVNVQTVNCNNLQARLFKISREKP